MKANFSLRNHSLEKDLNKKIFFRKDQNNSEKAVEISFGQVFKFCTLTFNEFRPLPEKEATTWKN